MNVAKICPVLAVGSPVHMSKCREGGCAWFNGTCVLVGIADALAEMAQKNSLPDAANTEQARGGTEFADTVSTSNDSRKKEEVQA